MNRLTAIACLLTHFCFGAEYCRSGETHYSIFGDVQNPQTYQVSQEAAVDSGRLIAAAGARSGRGTFFVLRDSAVSLVAAETYGVAASQSEYALEPSDAVLVVAPEFQPEGQGNALVLLRDIPDVLTFDGESIQAARVLEQLQLPDTIALDVSRIADGNLTTLKLQSESLVRHGDIIRLGESLADAGINVATAQVEYATAPAETQSVSVENDESDESKLTGLLTIPSVTNESNEIEQPQEVAQMELLPADPIQLSPVSDYLISPDEEVSERDQRPIDVHSASLSTDIDGSESPLAAPVTQQSSSNTIWNIVFVGGLLLAISLIAVGWIKTQQEINAETQNYEQQARRESTGAAPAATNTARSSKPQPLPGLVDSSTNDESPLPENTQPHTGIEGAELVGSREVEHAGFEPESSPPPIAKTPDVDEALLLTESWFETPAGHVTTEVVAPEISEPANNASDGIDPPGEIPGGETLQSQRSSEVVSAESPDDGNSTIPPSLLQPELAENQASNDHLEALIQNRLPIELTQASLPLRISLFGKPSGPRRLRIDAAHSEIAPPHMVRKSRERTRPGTQREKVAVPNPVRKPERAATIDEKLGHLDRALNFLEEQTDA